MDDPNIGKFPSLTGVIHFLIIKTVAQTAVATIGFPSLTGVIHFLIKNNGKNNNIFK